jgi:hypothetical protein
LCAAASQASPPTERTSSGTAAAATERLDLRDAVELLRDFERNKALTESEINREVDSFLAIITASDTSSSSRNSSNSSNSSSTDRGAHGRTPSATAGTHTGTTASSTGTAGAATAATTAAAAGVQEGFICPQCRRTLPSQQALMAHFSVLHAERRSSAEEEKERSEELSAGGRSRRSSLGGASVSLEQFITALQRFMEDEPHAGYVLL